MYNAIPGQRLRAGAGDRLATDKSSRGEGRPRKDGTKFTRSSRTTAYPPKLEDIGITKDQSSKWQRLIVALPSESTIRRTVDDTRGCERQTANPRDGGAGFS